MKVKIMTMILVTAVLSTLLVGFNQQEVAASVSNITGAYSDMNNPDFWIAQQSNPDGLIMSPKEIAEFSKTITKTEGTNCVDLASYPDTLTADALKKAIQRNKKSTELTYQGIKTISDEQYARYYENRNEQGVTDQNPVRWGVVVDNCELRTFPTSDVIYNSPNDIEFDKCCETVLKTGEQVAILTSSKDNSWYLVQSYNYLAWVPQKNIATTDKASWLEIGETTDFIVVTGNRVILDHNNLNPSISRRELTMGTRLPLVVDKPASVDGVSTLSSYVALIPERNADGSLTMTQVRLPMNLDVTVGYLPYTTRNITTQVFKFLGERYGWSSLWEARDCTAILVDTFQCFGIQLPRNTGNQKTVAGKRTSLSGLTMEQRKNEILKQPAGTVMYMPGHAVLYLGSYNGKPYIFHQTFAFTPENSTKEVQAATALVSDMNIKRDNGMSILEAITDVIVLKNP